MEARLRAERSVNMRMRGQDSSPSPWRNNQGSMKNRPQKLRQKVMTKPCRSLDRNLTWALRLAKHRAAKTVNPAAIKTWFGCPPALVLSKNMAGRHIREKGVSPPLPCWNCGHAWTATAEAQREESSTHDSIVGRATVVAPVRCRDRRLQHEQVPRQSGA